MLLWLSACQTVPNIRFHNHRNNVTPEIGHRIIDVTASLKHYKITRMILP
jgi:hypothetical protein